MFRNDPCTFILSLYAEVTKTRRVCHCYLRGQRCLITMRAIVPNQGSVEEKMRGKKTNKQWKLTLSCYGSVMVNEGGALYHSASYPRVFT